MKKLFKICLLFSFFVLYTVSLDATNVNIVISGDRETIQHNDYLEVICHPSTAFCLGIIINDQGTFIVWDNGGHDPCIQVDNEYITSTEEDGTVDFSFKLIYN